MKTDLVKQVLVVSLSNIGDAMLTLPVIEKLRSRYPDAAIDVIVGPRSKIVFDANADIRNIYIYDKKDNWKNKRHLFIKLIRIRYDWVVDLRKSLFSFVGKRRTKWARERSHIHKRDIHLSVLRTIDSAFASDENRSMISSPNNKSTEKISPPLVLIAPGARSDIKKWPGHFFSELANRLIDSIQCEIVWIGGEDDCEIIEDIQKDVKKKTVSKAGKLSWNQTRDLINDSQLVITNDSAPLHAADHAKKKTIALFGPTDFRKYGPQFTPGGIVSLNLFCSPCEKAQCKYNHECFKSLSVDEVFKRCLRVYNESCADAESRIGLIRLDRIGDVALTLPVFNAIRMRHPQSMITAIVRPHASGVVSRCDDVDSVLSYDYGRGGRHRSPIGYLRFLSQLRKKKFDILFILHPTWRSHLLAFLSGAKVRVGYKSRGSILLSHSISDLRHTGYQHEVQNMFDVVRRCRIPSPEIQRSRLRVYDSDGVKLNEALLLKGVKADFLIQPYAVIHAGASSLSKKWPVDYFKQVCAHLIESKKLNVVLVGDDDTKEINQSLKDFASDRIFDLTGSTTPETLAYVISKAKFFLTNDSGPSHIGAATDIRMLTIFGRNEKGLSSNRWRPIGMNSHFIQKDVGCVVCAADECPIEFECLKQLSPNEVIAKIDLILDSADARVKS